MSEFPELEMTPVQRFDIAMEVLVEEALQRAAQGETLDDVANDPEFITRRNSLLDAALTFEEQEQLAQPARQRLNGPKPNDRREALVNSGMTAEEADRHVNVEMLAQLMGRDMGVKGLKQLGEQLGVGENWFYSDAGYAEAMRIQFPARINEQVFKEGLKGREAWFRASQLFHTGNQ